MVRWVRKLGKPVELIVTPEAGHVSTRRGIASFRRGELWMVRFLAQPPRRSRSAKTEQYKRWRELRKLQEAQNAEQPANTGQRVLEGAAWPTLTLIDVGGGPVLILPPKNILAPDPSRADLYRHARAAILNVACFPS